MSRTIGDGDPINAVVSADSKSKTPENESSDEKIVTEKKKSWAEAAVFFNSEAG